MNSTPILSTILMLTLTVGILAAEPLGTAFTYQCQLSHGGQLADGEYDLRFSLYDLARGGAPVAAPITQSRLNVTNGLVSVTLDFGAAVFSGESRWLEIEVRAEGEEAFASLAERQLITPAPYALHALSAEVASTVASGAVTAPDIATGQVVKSINGLTDAVTLAPGLNLSLNSVGNTIQVDAAGNGTLRLEGPESGGTGGRLFFGAWPSSTTYVGELIDDAIFLVAPAGVGIGPGNLGIHLANWAEATHALTVGGEILARPQGGFVPGSAATLFLGDANNSIQAVWGEGLSLSVWQGANGLHLKNGGNVGIGTTDPQQRLDVAFGNAQVRGSDSFAGPGSVATLYLGDAVHYLRATREYGLSLGTWPVGDAITVREPDGRVGIGTTEPEARLDVAGTTRTAVLEITGGSDLAEPFEVSDRNPITAGAVVVIDEGNPGRLRLSTEAYDKRVAGVVSGAGSLKPGLTLSQAGVTDQGVPVALSGRVFVLADAAEAAIQPGDQLTTSATPGHARKVTDYERGRGAVLGKAMSSLEAGRGLVLVLVTLQ